MQYNLNRDKLLMLQIAEGDGHAFQHIFDAYKNQILIFVSTFVHSKADAEEIVQETFLKLWQSQQLLLVVEHPRNYIYTIARNKSIDYLTKIARNEKLLRLAWTNMRIDSNETEETIFANESRLLLNNALAQLSPQKQNIFRMSRFQGLSHDQIAAESGLSKSRVKNIIVEVLKFLKLSFSQYSAIWILIQYLFFV